MGAGHRTLLRAGEAPPSERKAPSGRVPLAALVTVCASAVLSAVSPASSPRAALPTPPYPGFAGQTFEPSAAAFDPGQPPRPGALRQGHHALSLRARRRRARPTARGASLRAPAAGGRAGGEARRADAAAVRGLPRRHRLRPSGSQLPSAAPLLLRPRRLGRCGGRGPSTTSPSTRRCAGRVGTALVQDRGPRGRSHGDAGPLRRSQRRARATSAAGRRARGALLHRRRYGRPSGRGVPASPPPRRSAGSRRGCRTFSSMPDGASFLVLTSHEGTPARSMPTRATSFGFRRRCCSAPRRRGTAAARGPAAGDARQARGARGRAVRRDGRRLRRRPRLEAPLRRLRAVGRSLHGHPSPALTAYYGSLSRHGAERFERISGDGRGPLARPRLQFPGPRPRAA